MRTENKLDASSLSRLRKNVNENNYDEWYSSSECAFPCHVISSESQLICAVAVAYSWMPTIPKWRGDKLDWKRTSKALNDLKKESRESVEEVFTCLVPVVNNSIIGLSKALHFSYPEILPIIDSNVVTAWIHHFGVTSKSAKRGDEPTYLPRSFNSGVYKERVRSLHISHYANYTISMQAWSKNTGESIRNIEKALYQKGKRITDGDEMRIRDIE